jgi:hypothetical protein
MSIPKHYYYIIITIFLIYLICAYHYSTPNSKEIAQVSVQEFTPELVRKHRVPYIMDELVQDPEAFIRTVFRYNYVYKKCCNNNDNNEKKTVGTYTILYGTTDDDDGYAVLSGTRVVVRKGRIIVLPARYPIDVSSSVQIVQLFDVTSIIATLGSLVNI